MNGHDRILAKLAGRPTDSLPLMPITMMFAADQIGVPYGRYAQDYRELVEAQLVTAERFGFDYVSCISDPAREAADCGAAIHFFDNQPPAIDETHALLAEKSTLARLKAPDPLSGGRMLDRVQAAALFRQKVGGQLLIEGWIEGPCAEAADLRGINRLMLDFYDDPQFVRDLFDFVLEMELRFAQAQVQSGVDLIGVGDAAASLVGPQIYEEFVLPYETQMVNRLHALGTRKEKGTGPICRNGPKAGTMRSMVAHKLDLSPFPVRLHICGNTNRILQGMGSLGCEIVDLDFPVPLAKAREAMGPRQVLLGNLDPVATLRNGTPQGITAAVAECHRQAGSPYIVGAGCEIPRDTPPENVLALRDYARSAR